MIGGPLQFDTFFDFYNRREEIRAKYEVLSPSEKWIYKYYVYSRRFLSEKICDAVWEYINAVDLLEFGECSRLLRIENNKCIIRRE